MELKKRHMLAPALMLTMGSASIITAYLIKQTTFSFISIK